MGNILSSKNASHSEASLFQKSRSIILKVGSHILAIVLGYKKRAKQNARNLSYRTESLDFFDVPKSLRGVSLLFLTDPHIGGNIDTLATEISTHIYTLLNDAHPEKTIVLHGGDFVCSESGEGMTTEAHFLEVSTKLFHGLSEYPQFGVIGNHDNSNHHFSSIRNHLESTHEIALLENPEDVQKVEIEGATIGIHGIHTLSTFLHAMPKEKRDSFLDAYIASLNEDFDCHVVLLHNPDGLEFLLSRLQETHKQLIYPTLFLAGHTHGAMLNIPILRDIGLYGCKTQFGRYKGWYGPEGKYTTTGNWKLYVSTGMGNSPGCDYRLNASPEVVLMRF